MKAGQQDIGVVVSTVVLRLILLYVHTHPFVHYGELGEKNINQHTLHVFEVTGKTRVPGKKQ